MSRGIVAHLYSPEQLSNRLHGGQPPHTPLLSYTPHIFVIGLKAPVPHRELPSLNPFTFLTLLPPLFSLPPSCLLYRYAFYTPLYSILFLTL